MTPTTVGKLRWLRLQGHQGEVFMCVWNPKANQLASGSADGVCRIWNLVEFEESQWSATIPDQPVRAAVMPHCQFTGEKFKDVTSVTWSPDGSKIATGCYDGTARIWDSTGALLASLKDHTGPVFSLKWNIYFWYPNEI